MNKPNFEMMQYCCKFFKKGDYFECNINKEMPKYVCKIEICPMVVKEENNEK